MLVRTVRTKLGFGIKVSVPSRYKRGNIEISECVCNVPINPFNNDLQALKDDDSMSLGISREPDWV
jgi:hypothetical protein